MLGNQNDGQQREVLCELPVYMQSSLSREPWRLPPGSQVNSERPSYAAASPHLGVCVYLCLCMVMVCSLALTPSTTTTAAARSAREERPIFFFFPSLPPTPTPACVYGRVSWPRVRVFLQVSLPSLVPYIKKRKFSLKLLPVEGV